MATKKTNGPIKVLLVEDDYEIQHAYAHTFTQHGFAVQCASNAEEGIQALLSQPRPDVMILDMLMPGLSGLEFLRQHNVAHRFPELYIIAFSNIDTPRVIADAKALGTDEYVLKVEVTPIQMVSVIKNILKNGKKNPQ